MRNSIIPYIKIARVDHWFKNIFMIPGIIVALFAQPDLLTMHVGVQVFFAFLLTGLIASSNYVLNEVLDAKYDALHPVKKSRPVPSGQVSKSIAFFQWIVLAVIGIGCSFFFFFSFRYLYFTIYLKSLLFHKPSKPGTVS